MWIGIASVIIVYLIVLCYWIWKRFIKKRELKEIIVKGTVDQQNKALVFNDGKMVEVDYSNVGERVRMEFTEEGMHIRVVDGVLEDEDFIN